MGILTEQILSGFNNQRPRINAPQVQTQGVSPAPTGFNFGNVGRNILGAFGQPFSILRGAVRGLTFGRLKLFGEPTTTSQSLAESLGELGGSLPWIWAAGLATGGIGGRLLAIPKLAKLAPFITKIPMAAKAAVKAPAALKFAQGLTQSAATGAAFETIRSVGAGEFEGLPGRVLTSAAGFAPFGVGALAATPVGHTLAGAAGVVGTDVLRAKLAGEELTPEQSAYQFALLAGFPFLLGGVKGGKLPKELENLRFPLAENRYTELRKKYGRVIPEANISEGKAYRSSEVVGFNIEARVNENKPVSVRLLEEAKQSRIIEAKLRRERTTAELAPTIEGGLATSFNKYVEILRNTDVPGYEVAKGKLVNYLTENVKTIEGKKLNRIESLFNDINNFRNKYTKPIVPEKINDERKLLIEFIKKQLPENKEKKIVLSSARKSMNEKELGAVVDRAGAALEASKKRDLVDILRKDLQRIRKNKDIDVVYKRLIENLVADLSLKGKPRAATLIRIVKTNKFIIGELSKGNIPDLPKYVLQEAYRLNQRPVGELSIAELADSVKAIRLLASLGKERHLMNRLTLIREEGKRWEVIAAQEGNPLSTREHALKMEGVAPPIDGWMKIKEAFLNFWGGDIRELEAGLTPMAPHADLIDGVKNYLGGFFKGVFDPIIIADGKARMRTALFTDKVNALQRKFGITAERDKVIYDYLVVQQRGGVSRIRLLATLFQKFDPARALIEFRKANARIEATKTVTADEKSYASELSNSLKEIYPEFSESMAKNYNITVEQVKNYFPFFIDWSLHDKGDVPLYEKFANTSDFIPPTSKGIAKARAEWASKGSEELRKRLYEGKVPQIRDDIGAGSAAVKYMKTAHFLIEASPELEIGKNIIDRMALEGKLGNIGTPIWNEWISTAFRNWSVPRTSIVEGLDILRKNTTIAVLAMRLSTILTQPSSLGDVGAQLGQEWLSKGMDAVMKKEIGDYLFRHSIEVRNRMGGETAQVEATEGTAGMRALLTKWGFAPLRAWDEGVVKVAMWGAYQKEMKAKGLEIDLSRAPDAEAWHRAEILMTRTQSTATEAHLPIAISSGQLRVPLLRGAEGKPVYMNNRSINRSMFQFQNFLLNRWSFIRHDAIRMGITDKNPVEAVRKLSWILLATVYASGVGALSTSILNKLSGKPETSDETKDRVLRTTLLNFAQNVPVIGTYLGSMFYDSYPIPSLGVIKDFTEIGGILTAKKKVLPGIRALETLGTAAGIPGITTLSQFTQNLYRSNTSNRADGIKAMRKAIKDLEKRTDLTEYERRTRIEDYQRAILLIQTAPTTR